MKLLREKKRALVSVLDNIVLVLFGLAIALVLAEMLMRAFPHVVPVEVRVNPPARRVKALIDETYDLRQSDGDLYHLMKGKIVPVSPDQDQVVAHVHMVTDTNGFRNSPPEKATYDIVALGDSFTRASGVASPWPQLLAEYTGSDVLNLGEVAFGPQDELKVLQQYGLQKRPQLVILAYFGGNDLYDAAAYDQANPFIVTRFGKYLWNQSTAVLRDPERKASRQDPATNYLYPMTVTANNEELEAAFFSYYVSWLSVDRETIEVSQNYRLASETILQMRDLSEAAEARFLLVYVPSKERIYLPYLNDADLLARVFADVPAIGLDAAGFLQFTNEKATWELTLEHMDDQANLLADFAAEHKILYLDLTYSFQEESAKGVELYYPFDTHWNQQGHDLAAETMARFLDDELTTVKSDKSKQ